MIRYPKFAQFLVDRFGAIIKKGEEFNFNCPKCGDTKRHFSFNLRKGVSNCFRCGYRPTPYEFLVENTDLSLDEIRELLQEDSRVGYRLEVRDGGDAGRGDEVRERFERGVEFPERCFEIDRLGGEFRRMILDWLVNRQGVREQDVFEFGFRVWLNDTVRVLIPCWDFQREKMIYWLARAIDDVAKIKYLYPAGVKRSMVFWGLDQVELWDGKIFLCEGWKDAYRMRGLALLGNAITDEQVRVLREVYSRYGACGVVVLLDSDAVDKGWEVVKRLIRERWSGEIWFGVLRGLKDPGEGRGREEVLQNTRLYCVRDGSGMVQVSAVMKEVFGVK